MHGLRDRYGPARAWPPGRGAPACFRGGRNGGKTVAPGILEMGGAQAGYTDDRPGTEGDF
jgi:hypothetical protein